MQYTINGVEYVDTNEAARRLGLSARTLINQRSENRSRMRYIRHGGRVYYAVTEVEQYAREQTW
ncbi:helix-turn-helix domain-containing protein [Micromonospora sp. NPDC049836]|uniref:helix-turn-helix domain-containing protein n=1 Tax=Micromonospora sp. NPDC049836 TaxID=3364274 RepID=UPI0037B87E6B